MYSLAFPSLTFRDYRLVEQRSRSPVLKKEGSEGLDLGMILSSVSCHWVKGLDVFGAGLG